MRYKLVLEYDGTNLLGWQRQLDGPSAQEYVETALSCFNHGTDYGSAYNPFEVYGKVPPISIFCAGRTDTGVHALGQVAHFDTDKDIDPFRLQQALNHHLRTANAPVSIISAEKVDENFHARFSARGRCYLYRILNRRAFPVLEKNRVWWIPYQLDIEKMRTAAQYLLGHHDFSSFRAAACQAKSPMKTLDKLDIIQVGEEIHFIVEARSFLHHQVRNMVGTLKMVGNGQLQPEEIKTILAAKDRTKSGPNAPSCGLYLSKVIY